MLMAGFCLLGLGCASTLEREEASYSSLRVYVGVSPDQTGRFQMAPIYGRSEIRIAVSLEPFLDEGSVEEARVVAAPGGFQLRVQFDRRGQGLLENMTERFRGRHLAILSHFPEARWLGAPFVKEPIRDGVLFFTPDATREEAERIAQGLNRVAAKLRGEG